MPTYQYKCEECGVLFERFQHFSEAPVDTCPECGGAVRRVIHPVGIIFKGSGFYVTDHRGNTSSLMPKAEPKEEKGPKETKVAKDSVASEPAKKTESATDTKA